MLDLTRLKEMTKIAQEKKAAEAALEEKKRQVEAKRKLEQEEIDRKKKLDGCIAYIDDRIKEAAEKGENSYSFNMGERYDYKLMQYLKEHYALLNPTIGYTPAYEILNYDMGTNRDFNEVNLIFYW